MFGESSRMRGFVPFFFPASWRGRRRGAPAASPGVAGGGRGCAIRAAQDDVRAGENQGRKAAAVRSRPRQCKSPRARGSAAACFE
eukprot:6750150-Lingulodinium_polyedra.AAC.1